MTTAKLMKLAPTLILIACLGYTSYSLHESLPARPSGSSEIAKGLAGVEEILVSGADKVEQLIGEARDPFLVKPKVSPPPDGAQPESHLSAQAASDRLAELVGDMTLEATFFQGRDQIAIIDGRIYSRGQALRSSDDSKEPTSRLVLTVVLPSRVILRGNNRNYVLSYPDQLGTPKERRPGGNSRTDQTAAMEELDMAGQLGLFQKLLNSPLGKMGKSLTGIPEGSEPGAPPRTSRRGNRQGSP